MYIENILREDSNTITGISNEIQPLFESWITGEDPDEITRINSEFNQSMYTLEENCMLAESLSFISELNGDMEKAVLLESKVGDFFGKAWANIKELIGRIRAFFVNLLNSAKMKFGKIADQIAKVDTYIGNKDMSGYTYYIHDWNDNPTLMAEVSTKAKSAVAEIKSTMDKILKNKDVSDDGANDSDETVDVVKERASIFALIGASEQESSAASNKTLKLYVEKKYGSQGLATEHKNFSSDVNKMKSYLRYFDSKAIGKVVDDSKKSLNEMEKAAKEVYNKTKALSSDSDEEKQAISAAKTSSKLLFNAISTLIVNTNTILKACVAQESKRFGEYKSALIGAIRYNPKEASK